MRRVCPAFGLRLCALAGLLLVGVSGCLKTDVRSQSEDQPQEARYDVRTIGDVTTFANADPLPVGGVALVTGLHGTGSAPRKGNLRSTLEKQLQTARIPNIKSLLDSKDTALVVVSTEIPPGARPGDKLDIEVRLPPGSRTSSLQGGYLQYCPLKTYARAGDLSSRFAGSGINIQGRTVAVAQGQLLVGIGTQNDPERMRRGFLWGGAKCKVPRPFHLILDPEYQEARLAMEVAERVNATFQDDLRGAPKEMARAKDNVLIFLGVPAQYRRNLQRYLRIVRAIPLSGQFARGNSEKPTKPYRVQLAEDLLEPQMALKAALRLEALGRDSEDLLKPGLKSKDPYVRFFAAEALAYLGSSSSVDQLAESVKTQPVFRSYALTALASLDESITLDQLRRLAQSDLDDETRYGAFRALRALSKQDPIVQGQNLNGSFYLHHVSADGNPMVHLSMRKRPEVVVFGARPRLIPPFSLLAGEFTVTANENEAACTIKHYDVGDKVKDSLSKDKSGISEARVPLVLEQILITMAKQGASYSDVLEMIRQAEEINCLSCRVRRDALPQRVTVRQLVKAGEERGRLINDPNLSPEAIAALDVIKLGETRIRETGSSTTPTARQTVRRSRQSDDESELLRKPRSGDERRTAHRRELERERE